MIQLTEDQRIEISKTLVNYSISLTEKSGPVAYPSKWPKYLMANEPCDMISGPCCCGAWHKISDWWHVFGLEKPTFYGLKGTAISSGGMKQK